MNGAAGKNPLARHGAGGRKWRIASSTSEGLPMPIPLYDLSVTGFLQTLGGVSGYLEKARTHFESQGADLNEIVQSRLYPDMLDFRFQIVSVAHHSAGAIEGCKAGVFSPPGTSGPSDYAGLQQLVADARARLQGVSADEVNALEGREVVFQFGERRVPFTVENFLMSFSLPNLHFHATTAYDILRSKGAPLGKRDYTGQLRIKV
jgi:uncharacterized protein